jgi:hypothetical protein
MGFSLSGRVAGGAQDAVAEQIQTILAQKKFEEQIRAQQAQEQMAQQQLALGTRRQNFAESQAEAEAQQSAIEDMRAQQEKQKVNLTRLNTEQEVNDLINQIGDPNAKIVSGLRARGVNAPTIETPVDPEVELQRDIRKHEELKKIDAKYRPQDSGDTQKHPHVVNGKLVYLTADEVNAMGGIEPPSGSPKPPTGMERNALGFYLRAKDADETIAPLEEKIGQMTLAGQARLEWAPNFAQSQIGQSYRQAQRAFTEARLRKESGAAVPQSEYDNDARTYFAQPGDSAQSIEQKRQKRQVVLRSIALSAGRSYDEYFGAPLDKNDTITKEQVNKRTGERRTMVSTDGGKTWQVKQ